MSKQELMCLLYAGLIGGLNAAAFLQAAKSYLDRSARVLAILTEIPQALRAGWHGPSAIPVAVPLRRPVRR